MMRISKKSLKKCLTLFLAFIMVFSFAITSFAANNNNGNNGNSGNGNGNGNSAATEVSQTIFLKGSGSSFTDDGWQNIFYVGGAEDAAEYQAWHLVYSGKNFNAITEAKVTFTNGEVFNWTPSMGPSVNNGGNNMGWVIVAPLGWEIAYVDKGNNNNSESSLVTKEAGNVNYNISGYNKYEYPTVEIVKTWLDADGAVAGKGAIGPDGEVAVFDVYDADGNLIKEDWDGAAFKVAPGTYKVVEQAVDGYDPQEPQFITVKYNQAGKVAFVNVAEPSDYYGSLKFTKTTNGLEVIEWDLLGIDVWDVWEDISFKLFAATLDSDGKPVGYDDSVVIGGAEFDLSGEVTLNFAGELNGWYAVVEFFTTGSKAEEIFNDVGPQFVFFTNGLADEFVFDNDTTPPPPPPTGKLTLHKTIGGAPAADFEFDGITLADIIDDMIFTLYPAPGNVIDYTNPITTGIMDADGNIVFAYNAEELTGINAVVETFTPGSLAAQIFQGIAPLFLDFRGLGMVSSNQFDYSANYQVVNNYAANRFVLGYDGLTDRGNIFYIGITKMGSSPLLQYDAFCAWPASSNFAGSSAWSPGCTGHYIVTDPAGSPNNVVISDMISALNYIEDNYGGLKPDSSSTVNPLPAGNNRRLTQVVMWSLLGHIDVDSAAFAATNLTAAEKAAVIDVVKNSAGYVGSGTIVDVAYVSCSQHGNDYTHCQPLLIPIYDNNIINNVLK